MNQMPEFGHVVNLFELDIVLTILLTVKMVSCRHRIVRWHSAVVPEIKKETSGGSNLYDNLPIRSAVGEVGYIQWWSRRGKNFLFGVAKFECLI